MPKAGQGKFERPGGASRLSLGFKNLHLQSLLSDNDRRCKAIRTGADNASSVGHVRFSLAREFIIST
jgi:hypothetical protein